MLDRRALLAAAVAAFPAAPLARDGAPDLNAAREAAGVPALGGVWIEGGEVRWLEVVGLRAVGADAAVTTADPWHLGSNTKAMTAALFARLVEAGRTDWEARVVDLLPSVAADPAWAETRLTALMAHRAGLLDQGLLDVAWLNAARADVRPVAEQRRALAARALATSPAGVPGAFAYGNANYIVVGAALEALTGEPWEELMRREVFGPLGMGSAGFGPPMGEAPLGHADVFGHLSALTPETPGADNPPALGPAGTVHASLADYARFLRAFTGWEHGWLSADSIRRLMSPEGADGTYALGWGFARQGWAAGPVLAHEGSNTRWHALAVVDPAGGRALATVSNGGPRGGPVCQALAREMIRAFAA